MKKWNVVEEVNIVQEMMTWIRYRKIGQRGMGERCRKKWRQEKYIFEYGGKSKHLRVCNFIDIFKEIMITVRANFHRNLKMIKLIKFVGRLIWNSVIICEICIIEYF